MVTWDTLRSADMADLGYVKLLSFLGSRDKELDEMLLDLKKYLGEMTVVDGVVLYGSRVFIPKSLHGEVVWALHRAHQGATGMALRASETVWWPGLSRDLQLIREPCGKCVRNAPSHPAAPLHPLPSPEYHFQLVSADYFTYSGSMYLVVVDRYSGWPTVLKCKEDSYAELV